MKDLRLVEFAVALGRHRNFARAAESVGVTQPTFSRGIASLEEELGCRLFDRSTRRVEPTSAGMVFLERADAVLTDAARLDELVRDHEQLVSGQLAIAAGPYPLELSVIAAVARIAAMHPKLRIRVVEGPWRDFTSKLLAGLVDVAVMEASVLVGDHRVQVEPLPRHQGVLFSRARHPLAGRPRLSMGDLQPYPLVGIPTVREVQSRLGEAGGSLNVDSVTGDVNPHITVTSNACMREIVKRTDGIGLCTRSQIEDDLRTRRLIVLDVDFELPETGYGIVQLRGRSASPAALVFAQVLREVEEELRQSETKAAAMSKTSRSRRRRSS
jgi:DNA-binding transcriptional LysR family regulator